jgi:hypothetical protein
VALKLWRAERKTDDLGQSSQLRQVPESAAL